MASDLISRAAASERMKSMAGCDACNNYDGVRCRACTWDDAMNIVDELPSVDAIPVEWMVSWINRHPNDLRCAWFASLEMEWRKEQEAR